MSVESRVARYHLRRALILVVIAIGALPTLSAEVSPTTSRQWVTDAPVESAATIGDTAYLGGGFNYLGLVTPNGPSFLDQASGAVAAGCATRTGTQAGVRPSVVPDPSGGLFMQVPLAGERLNDGGGDFVVPSGESFVRVGGDCRFVRTFHLQTFVPGDTATRGLTIARAGDVIYIGGARPVGLGDQYGRVAAFDGTSGARVNAWDFDRFGAILIEGVTPTGQLVVTAPPRLAQGTTQEVGILQPSTGFFARLAVVESLGSFVRVAGNTLFVLPAANQPLQAFDLATGQAKPGWSRPVLTVTDLEVGGGRVFVAGSGLGRRGVFALTEATGTLVESFEPAFGAAAGAVIGIERLALVDTRLFVRGRTLRTLSTSGRYLLAAVDATTGAADAWAPVVFAPTATSIDLVPLGTRLFIGRVTASTLEQRRHLAAVDTESGAVLPFDPNAAGVTAPVPGVTALTVSESHLFAGTSQGQIRRIPLSTGVLDTWTVTTSVVGAQPGAIAALLLGGETLFAGGHFTSATTSSQPAAVARGHGLAVNVTTADLEAWNPQVTSGASDPTQSRRPITSLSPAGDLILVGGNFSAVGGQPRVGLAAVDAATAEPVLPALTLATGEIVLDTDQDENQIYFVGVGVGEDDRPLIGVADTLTATVTRWAVGPPPAGTPSAAIAWSGGVVYSGVEWDLETEMPREGSPAWVRPVAAETGLLELEDLPDGPDGASVTRFHPAGDGNALTAPRDLTVQYSGTEVFLTWRAPVRGPIQSYVVRAGPAAGESGLADFDTGSAATTLSARAPEGVYFVRIHARRPEGVSGPSNEVSFALVPFGCNAVPRAPVGLTGTASADGATLEWGAAVGAASYLVEAGSQPGAADIAILDMGTRLNLQTSAPPGRYFVRTRGLNSCGRGAASNEVVLTVGGPPPGAPSNLTVQVAGRTATLAWDAPTSGAVPEFYQLEAGSSPGSADVAVARSAERVFVATGAVPGTYYVRVRAGNAAGLSAPTTEVQVTITP
jgi:hypothetical protein